MNKFLADKYENILMLPNKGKSYYLLLYIASCSTVS